MNADGLARLSPAYFGLVMATGIVAIGAQLHGFRRLALTLFVLNLAAYGVLWALYLLRVQRHSQAFLDDLFDHLRAPGFFTSVAATGILASEFIVLVDEQPSAIVLWVLAIVLWVALTYTIFTSLIVKPQKPTLDRGINGAWLLAVVATQSIAVLSALLAARLG